MSLAFVRRWKEPEIYVTSALGVLQSEKKSGQ